MKSSEIRGTDWTYIHKNPIALYIENFISQYFIYQTTSKGHLYPTAFFKNKEGSIIKIQNNQSREFSLTEKIATEDM